MDLGAAWEGADAVATQHVQGGSGDQVAVGAQGNAVEPFAVLRVAQLTVVVVGVGLGGGSRVDLDVQLEVQVQTNTQNVVSWTDIGRGSGDLDLEVAGHD